MGKVARELYLVGGLLFPEHPVEYIFTIVATGFNS